jgi:hypothetical protein
MFISSIDAWYHPHFEESVQIVMVFTFGSSKARWRIRGGFL